MGVNEDLRRIRSKKIEGFLPYDEFKKMADEMAVAAAKSPTRPGGDTAKSKELPGAKKGP